MKTKKQSFLLRTGVLVLSFLMIFVFSGCTQFSSTTETDKPTETKSATTTYDAGYRFDQNGWTYIHIEGDPYSRGKQHGYLAAEELGEVKKMLEYLTYFETGKEWSFFVENAERIFADRIDQEYIDEMKGIADGATEAGTDFTWQEVLAWNGYEELTGYWWPNEKEGKFNRDKALGKQDHCSAFMATGSQTSGGQVVMAHNSWSEFVDGQYLNIILDIKPSDGYRIFMQSSPGYIDSMADFFVTEAGIMGTETTMGGYSLYDPEEDPEFFRVRKAMQYAGTLDEFTEIMKKKNNGGYANSWLLANKDTGEIMRFELGLQYSNIERTKDGYYIGFNAPIDPRIRNLETENSGFADIRRHQGARQVRLEELMQEHKGKVDVEIGKEVLADHYDVYLEKENNPSSRTVDGHYELDAREYMSEAGRPKPYQPRGAVDGKVMDSDMAGEMSFDAIWGNSSGMPFNADAFLDEHIQYSHLEGYLKDRPAQAWTLFSAGQR